MARQAGSKVIECTNPKCGTRLVGFPGEQVICKKCGTKIRLTKAILAAEKKPVAKNVPAKKSVKKVAEPVAAKKSAKATTEPVAKKRGRPAKAK
jgi:hypothetical protein